VLDIEGLNMCGYKEGISFLKINLIGYLYAKFQTTRACCSLLFVFSRSSNTIKWEWAEPKASITN